MVDGRPWPAVDDEAVWLPAGAHTVEPGPPIEGLRLARLNGELKTARFAGGGAMEFSYASDSRALAVLDRPPSRIEIDGVAQDLRLAGPRTILLPRGQHVVRLEGPAVTLRAE